MNLPDFLFEYGPDAIRLTGTRIGLEHVLDLHKAGSSAEDLRDWFPDVPDETLKAVIEYYRGNTDEVEAYLRSAGARAAEFEAAHPPGPTLRRIRAAAVARRGTPEPAS